MSTSAVISALQTRHAALSGVTSAPTALPASLKSVELPCALVFLGDGTHSFKRMGDTNVDRTYIVRCYVSPVAQGQGPDDGYQAVISLIDVFTASYDGDRNVGTTARIGVPYRDSGHMIQAFSGVDYHTFEFMLPIREL